MLLTDDRLTMDSLHPVGGRLPESGLAPTGESIRPAGARQPLPTVKPAVNLFASPPDPLRQTVPPQVRICPRAQLATVGASSDEISPRASHE